MIFGIHGMDVLRKAKDVKIVICIIWIINMAKMVQIYTNLIEKVKWRISNKKW